MYFDTHTHVNFPEYNHDREGILKQCSNEKIWITNVGVDFETSKQAVDLASGFDRGVYAAIGLHPTEIQSFNEDEFAGLITKKVVAVGECGLDYYHKDTSVVKQKAEFVDQIHFAQKHSLPLIIHCRDAYDDLIEILKAEHTGPAGIIHSFTDSWETAKRFLDLGFYIGLNAILIFDKTGRLTDVAKNAPSDRILTETDAPFLTPPPERSKRNVPMNVKTVAARIGELRGVSQEKIGEMTYNNALKVFDIHV